MNNQVKQLIDKETFVNFLKSEINNWNGSSDMYASVRVDCLQWVIDRIENNNAQVGLIDTPPVPTIGCSECDFKGYYEYETGVVDEGTQIKEIAKEPCDCVIDPVPTIKPGDKHRCPYCYIASTQQEWDEATDKAYNGDTATIHDCKTLNWLALFVCPACGEEAELEQMEVVE